MPHANEGPGHTDAVIYTEEAAELLGVSLNTIYNEIHAGDLPALRIGRRFAIPRTALAAMLEGREWRTEFPGTCQYSGTARQRAAARRRRAKARRQRGTSRSAAAQPTTIAPTRGDDDW